MGRSVQVEEEEQEWRGNGDDDDDKRMDSIRKSLSNCYAESVRDSLKSHKFNFVISDPRLPDNPIVYASDSFCKMTGYSCEEVLGKNCRFLQGPETDRRAVLEIRDAIREERACQVRILNYNKEGKPFWNLFHLAPVYAKNSGIVIHFVGVQTPMSSDLAIRLHSHDEVGCHIVAEFELPYGPSANKYPHNGVRKSSSDLEMLLPDSTGLTFTHGARRHGRRLPEIENIGQVVPDSLCDRKSSNTNVNRHFRDEGMEGTQKCNVEDADTLMAVTAVRMVLCQLAECSREKVGVEERRCKQLSESAEGILCSSLMLSLTRIQQSFVLADPHLPDMPVVHASDLFLRLTGYNREEVLGQNCRFLQGPGTDPHSVAQIRESMKLERPCSVRLLNYRKDRRPFWNLLHVSPVRSSGGKVAFYVGVQLDVSSADEIEGQEGGMSAQMRQLGAVGAVRVAVRSLQGSGLRRSIKGI